MKNSLNQCHTSLHLRSLQSHANCFPRRLTIYSIQPLTTFYGNWTHQGTFTPEMKSGLRYLTCFPLYNTASKYCLMCILWKYGESTGIIFWSRKIMHLKLEKNAIPFIPWLIINLYIRVGEGAKLMINRTHHSHLIVYFTMTKMEGEKHWLENLLHKGCECILFQAKSNGRHFNNSLSNRWWK